LNRLAYELAGLFEVYNYEWKFEDGLKLPTEDDIAKTLDGMHKRLYDEKDPLGSMEVGRIRMQRHDDKAEVYLYLGDYDEQDS